MRFWPLAALVLLAAPARAATLDVVRATGAVRCGATARAGFADADEAGRVTGLAVDLCRALTIALLGPAGRTEFHIYDTARDYDAVRDGTDDVAFLAADAVVEQKLAAAVVPGPVAFIAGLTVLAQPGVTSLDGATVCFMNGSPAHQALEAWDAAHHAAMTRIGFQEIAEMQDAFDAGRCGAITGEASELAEFRAGSPHRAAAHILPPLGLLPVLAATPVGDGAWAGLVGWALAAVVQSEASPSAWRSNLPGVAAPGLRAGWQAEVMGALGSYQAMWDRNLGAGSGLRLPPGPNAPWPQGVLLPPGPR